MSRLSVIGSGYVGLVTGACLAEKGHHVTCVDLDDGRVRQINRAECPIFEPGLDELLRRNVGARLVATTDLGRAVLETALSIITVGTPSNGGIDLSQVRSVSRQVGEALRDKDRYHAVVVKSTVVPGTTDEVVIPLLEQHSKRQAGHDFGVGVNPEFLREGAAVEDFMQPDRIVLGGMDDRTVDALEDVYRVFHGADVIRTTNRTAEMIKYASNSLFATLISFANEIANLCSAVGGIDVVDVMRGVHLDRRVSPLLPEGQRVQPALTSYLEAGCGFGGSCFPKDLRALLAHGQQHGLPMELLDAVMRVNERQPSELLRLLRKHHPLLQDLRVTVLGLAFKPGTDDVRESPAIPIVAELLAEGASVTAYDPVVREQARRLFADDRVIFCESLEEAVQSAEVVLVVTRWAEFERLPALLRGFEEQPLVVDGRRMLDKTAVARYEGIGL